tara:strand:- start:459 stop:680 length:222 start_codon:yes stop_codon:yes gene_type:complete
MSRWQTRSDPYGPYSISQGKAFIKYSYVPFDLGSLELNTVVNNKIQKLTEELDKWNELLKENKKLLEMRNEPT